ncbi:MAG: SusC/RagA family TonB-linked outer membrane protein, partial [Ferruginibacter sp.]
AAGKILLDASGVPSRGTLIPWGSAYAKWIGGWTNEFSYKNFRLSFLIDGKFGGKIFSGTDYEAYNFGLHKATLVNREGTFGNNLNASTYYSTLISNVSKLLVQDASFIKFRQVILSYNFPDKFFKNAVKGASLSLVARNLFFIKRKTDNIDPEGDYTPDAYGLELGGVPTSRTYGINLNLKF